MLASLAVFVKETFINIRSVEWTHWLIDIVIIYLGLQISEPLGEAKIWTEARFSVYAAMHKLIPNPPQPRDTAVILLDDEDYWKTELARRSPIKRDYLARLVRKLHEAKPGIIIALDFDFSSPLPDGSVVESPEYLKETQQLSLAIQDVSKRSKIVLPKTVEWADEHENTYKLDSWIFGNDIACSDNIRCGFINLGLDIREFPLPLQLADGSSLDSFAAAIARYKFFGGNDTVDAIAKNSKSYFVRYISNDKFPTLSGREVLQWDLDKLRDANASKKWPGLDKINIVLIGAGWHKYAFGQGDQVDSYLTPLGFSPGVYVHANYVEAILDGRLFPAHQTMMHWLEYFFTGVIAIALAIHYRYAFLLTLFVTAGMAMVTYFALVNFGVFSDFFVPVILLLLHYSVGNVLEWRSKAKLLDKHGGGYHG